MTEIKRVGMLDNDIMEIQLCNGNTVLLETRLIIALPRFSKLLEDDRILYPRTDGRQVFWRNERRRLSLKNIIELTFQNENEEGIIE